MRSVGAISSLTTTQKKKKGKAEGERITLFTNDKAKRLFPLVRDNDLGLDRSFQVMLHPTSHDDDCDTDEEQLECSRNYCLLQLREGIEREFGASALELLGRESQRSSSSPAPTLTSSQSLSDT